jgi:hypothetical protein
MRASRSVTSFAENIGSGRTQPPGLGDTGAAGRVATEALQSGRSGLDRLPFASWSVPARKVSWRGVRSNVPISE